VGAGAGVHYGQIVRGVGDGESGGLLYEQTVRDGGGGIEVRGVQYGQMGRGDDGGSCGGSGGRGYGESRVRGGERGRDAVEADVADGGNEQPRAQTWDVLRDWHFMATTWAFEKVPSVGAMSPEDVEAEARAALAGGASEVNVTGAQSEEAGGRYTEGYTLATGSQSEEAALYDMRRRRTALDLGPLLADIDALVNPESQTPNP